MLTTIGVGDSARQEIFAGRTPFFEPKNTKCAQRVVGGFLGAAAVDAIIRLLWRKRVVGGFLGAAAVDAIIRLLWRKRLVFAAPPPVPS